MKLVGWYNSSDFEFLDTILKKGVSSKDVYSQIIDDKTRHNYFKHRYNNSLLKSNREIEREMAEAKPFGLKDFNLLDSLISIKINTENIYKLLKSDSLRKKFLYHRVKSGLIPDHEIIVELRCAAPLLASDFALLDLLDNKIKVARIYPLIKSDELCFKYFKHRIQKGSVPDTESIKSEMKEFEPFKSFDLDRLSDDFVHSRPDVELFHSHHYYTASEQNELVAKYDNLIIALEKIKTYNISFLKKYNLYNGLISSKSKDFLECCSDAFRKKHNKDFIKEELRKNKDYFNNLPIKDAKGTTKIVKLNKQQRKAIVQDEDNSLVISAAGSGKTTTILAKANYLVEKRSVSPADILIVTFNAAPAEEISNRLSPAISCKEISGLLTMLYETPRNEEYKEKRNRIIEKLNTPMITCSTFHSLATLIVRVMAGKPYIITDDDVKKQNILDEVFTSLLEQFPNFKENVMSYFGNTQTQDDEINIENLSDDNIYDYIRIRIRSEEEKRIRNCLIHLGIHFEYEKEVKDGIFFDSSDNKSHRPYIPDFTISWGPKNCNKIYFEHFGVDKDGNVPRFFAHNYKCSNDEISDEDYNHVNDKYRKDMNWKKEVGDRINSLDSKETKFIFTTSAEIHNLSFDELEDLLIKRLTKNAKYPKEEIHRASLESIYSIYVKKNPLIESDVIDLSTTFIQLLKSSQKNLKDIISLTESSDYIINHGTRDYNILIKIIKPFYDKYEEKLMGNSSEGQDYYDFNDIINNATKYCIKEKQPANHHPNNDCSDQKLNCINDLLLLKHHYKYILVDEFQDITKERYDFIEALREDGHSKIFCVGDDWQSINRFSGSDLSIIKEFKAQKSTATFYINQTYRFGEPTVTISSNFIMNKYGQIDKNVLPKHGTTTEISLEGYENEADKLSELIDKLPQDTPQKKSNIFLLGRYNDIFDELTKSDLFTPIDIDGPDGKNKIIKYKNRTLKFFTIHKAKGLEADYVFVLDCNSPESGKKSFPSNIKEKYESILDLVRSNDDGGSEAEERRLFYVAITRARKKTFVLYDTENPSEFVEEIKNIMMKINEKERQGTSN